MKKNTKQTTVLIALIALSAGFMIGLFFSGVIPADKELTGTIGRVDRARNVQITEEDIKLRNELADNLEMRDQYVEFLNFFYNKSLRTSQNLSQAMEHAATVDAFDDIFKKHSVALENYSAYLEVARTDILEAMGALTSIEDDSKRPMVELLNQAFNAINRMRNNDDAVVDFMIAISTFMEEQEVFYPKLADAHDILVINSLESAMAYRNKPMLHYLKRTTLKNDEEGITILMTGFTDQSTLQELTMKDMTRLNFSDELRNTVIGIVYSQLRGIIFNDKAGQIGSSGLQQVMNVIHSQESFEAINSFTDLLPSGSIDAWKNDFRLQGSFW